MNETYRPTGETALIIVPPPDVCGYADHYRAQYMADQFHTIEPHITVTYPFVPYDQLEEATPRLREVLASCPPRRVSLRHFAIFPDEGILFIEPADPERVLSIYRAVLAEFPEYPAYGGKFGDNIRPHLTVGVIPDREKLQKVYDELAVQRLYIGFEVEQVVVKYKLDDGIWDTWAELPLGGGTVRS